MKKHSRLDYAYSVGRVRALERGLMHSSIFREATEEKNFSGVLKLLFDAGSFSKDWSDVNDFSRLNEILEQEEGHLNKEVFELLMNKELYEILEMTDRPQDVMTLTEKLGNPFISGYVRHSVDLGNLKTFLRFKYLGLPAESLSDRLWEGGFVDKNLYTVSQNLSFSEFGEKLHVSPYKHLWEEVTDALLDRDTFVVMERGFENFLMEYLRRARHIVFGPEPVFAYALARRRELKLIRLVATGKMNQVPPKAIKERISETYV